MTKTLLICPLGPEAKHIRAHCPDIPIFIGGHGKASFAAKTSQLILEHSPELVICAGAAGGHPEYTRVFDIVVGHKTVEHDYHEKFSKNFQKPTFEISDNVCERFPQNHGVIASGDEDIVTRQRADEIHQLCGATAFAWEGAGGARACRLHGVDFVEVRTITDHADENAGRDFKKNLPEAMKRLGEFLRGV